jgi:CelD/BcsL family acetyltransferase involved in cellulose biosynthesis
MRGRMPIEVLTEIEQLAAREPQWRELWLRSADATPFQSPMWLLPWWRTFGMGELHAIAGFEGDVMTSLAPLMVLREDDESLGMVAGSGNSDYVDILGSADSMFARLAEIDCQMWDLQQLRPSSPLLTTPLPHGWSDSVSEQDLCPVLPIDGAGAELENLVSTHFRKKLRYYRRSLERLGSVRVESANAANIDVLMTALFELHAARWKSRGLPGMLAADVDQEFHRAASRAMLQHGALRLYATYLEDRIVAVFYGFGSHGTVYYYLSGFDPELEKLSIGTVTVAHAIEQAVRDGAHTFDFLRGAEQYKYTWGAKDRPNSRRQVFPPPGR